MSTIATPTRYTPEDLLTLPDGDRYELVYGRLVERDMGYLSSWVGGKLHRLIGNFGEDHRLGWVAPADAGFQCFPNSPNLVRRPDVSFICRGRLPGEQFPEGHVRIPPDLAVEVVSPNDLVYEIDEKVDEYLEVGVRLVWVVNPHTRTVRVHRADGSITQVRATDELSGEDVLPGFRCPVGEIFPPPVAPGPAP